MARFTATHGVHLADLDVQFKYDAEATNEQDTPSGLKPKVYALETDKKDVIAELERIAELPKGENYGIRKVSSKKSTKDAPPTVPATLPAGEKVDYSGMKVGELRDLIASRNEDRGDDDQIVPEEPGNKPELIAALEADDKS